LKLDRLTTGAGNDFERATEMARKMVCEWGMSEKMGPLTFGKQEEQIFLGREIAQHRDYSEATAVEIDHEVKRIILEGYNRARRILEDHDSELAQLAEALLEREVLDAEEIGAIVEGRPMPAVKTPSDGETPEKETSDGANDASETTQPKTGKGPGVLPEPGNQPA
jgi:cell division protease FtsH